MAGEELDHDFWGDGDNVFSSSSNVIVFGGYLLYSYVPTILSRTKLVMHGMFTFRQHPAL